jgi:alkylation response protein AidB-like acyl-CoA dehydrogenase
VSDAAAATHLIVAARTGDGPADVSLLLVDARAPGVRARRLPGFLSWQDEVRFDGVEVPASALLGGRDNQGWAALERALGRALPVLCSYMVGGCQAVYEVSVKHSQQRVQFGGVLRAPGRVQDHIIRLVNHLDAARWTTAEALWKLDTERTATDAVHLAKAVTSESYHARRATPRTKSTRARAASWSTAWWPTRRCRARSSPISAIRAGTSAAWPTRWRE